MARMIHCVKLKQEAEGLEFPPYPGELGTKIWHSISKQAWANWMDVQTRLVNENRLNLADARARTYLKEQMEQYLFENKDVEADGFTAPSA
ncbi:oxidative damage protection protein [Alcaligenes faecalis subsp. faecalis]|uniref:oxidative damage protection protein n=1 Tax=Alcaligenes faecalis TaxID=511 RepID=UPI001F009091|nr:oxidative damage protection protein [Alcaligenes faecalis]MBW4790284.1 oxidative damage protection protein [Alcaligenes faecalis subsp. faecalis]